MLTLASSTGNTNLGGDVRPVDAAVVDVEVEGRGVLDPGERDDDLVVVRLQGETPDVGAPCEQQEGLRDDADLTLLEQTRRNL